MAFLVRPAGSSTPTKIKLSNLKIIKSYETTLKVNGYLNYYRPLMSESVRMN